MKILIVSGFLGAGKTTFIKELIRRTGQDIVILKNEYGDTNIDKGELSSSGDISVPELIMLLEDALRGRYGGIVRAKGILETGGGYVRFDLADGLYSITGADGVSTEPQCVFIGRQLRPAEIAARLADPAAFI